MIGALLRYFLSPSDYLVNQTLKRASKQVALYGAGEFGIEVAFNLKQHGVLPVAWADRAAEEKAFNVFNQPVLSPGELVSQEFDTLVICSIAFAQEIEDACVFLRGSEK